MFMTFRRNCKEKWRKPFSLSIRVQQTVEAGNIGFVDFSMDVWTWYNVKYLWASTFNTNMLLFCSAEMNFYSFLWMMLFLVLLVKVEIKLVLLLSHFLSFRSVGQLNTQLSRFSFCSFVSSHDFLLVCLFPVEALRFSSSPPPSPSLASLAMPSFSRPTRTNLMGDKSGWLTMIKKHGEKV